ncbi:hypothetical protein niasHT_033853 [Heterodera trifolii]|uniref:Ubiquitin-like domain-containing protein n=1 Tax=Heterodera trifolii TaxID=157864 RepID=A0ABD2I596_9BILA
MNQFCFVGICAGLAMLMLMIMPSSIADDKFKIKVEGDKNAIVYVKKTDTVLKVKEKIVEQLTKNINEEIEIINEKLKKNNYENSEILTARITLRLNENGSPFEDDEIMKDCGTEKDTVPKTIYLTLDEFKIKVEGDKNTTVSVNETDKVSELKEKIVEQLKKNMNKEIKILEAKLEKSKSKIHKLMEKLINAENTTQALEAKLGEKNNEKYEILPERITLRLQKNGPPLEDDQIIKDCGIVNGTIPKDVYLTLDKFKIKVEGDKNMIIYVKDTDTVLKVKEQIVEKLDAEKKNDAETKILPERLTLRRCKYGRVFEDQKTMKEYDIEKFPVLFLTLDEFKIKSYLESDDFGWSTWPTVMVNGQDTVADLKRKFAEETKIEPKRQMLRLGGPFGPTLEDSKTMKDYSIEKDQVISITFDEYKIFVHFNKEKYPIWVRKEERLRLLKKKVKQMLINEFKISLGEKDVNLLKCESFADCDMFAHNLRTMEEYNIIENRVIYVYREHVLLELAMFDIFIEYKKKKYQVQVKGTDKVSDLKAKIGNIQENGILPNQQNQLICQAEDGEVLEDDRLIAFSKIAKNSTVFLTLAEIEQQEEEKPSSSSNFASPQMKNKRGGKNKQK